MKRFLTDSLRSNPWGERVARVLEAAIQAVEPGKAVQRFLQLQQHGADHWLLIAGQAYDLQHINRIFLVGAGKAGAPMANAASHILGERISGGVIIAKEGYANLPQSKAPSNLQILEAGHPLPDNRGVNAALSVQSLMESASADDLVICLLSGGGSALLVSPAPDISLTDLQNLTQVLLASGVSINEINTLRKHLETLKGGGLARLAYPARVAALILSDVVGDPLEVIASGPTVSDPSTYAEAQAILERYRILDQVPASVLNHLKNGMRGEIPETPKPGDPVLMGVQNVIVGSNRQAARAALEQAKMEGMNSLLLTTFLQGEASQSGRALAAIARQIDATGDPLPRPACIVVGGETTVTVTGGGLGGRNQELALGAVVDLAGLSDMALISLATDGGDGLTDAAGAVATGQTLERALNLGLHPAESLRHNDAYHFFEPLGDLLKPGPTQTNVNDLAFIFAF